MISTFLHQGLRIRVSIYRAAVLSSTGANHSLIARLCALSHWHQLVLASVSYAGLLLLSDGTPVNPPMCCMHAGTRRLQPAEVSNGSLITCLSSSQHAVQLLRHSCQAAELTLIWQPLSMRARRPMMALSTVHSSR